MSNLLFIVSQPRSGSTLLQAILSNNNQVATASEPWLLLPFLSIKKPGIVQAEYDYSLASKAVHEFISKAGGEIQLDKKLNSFLTDIYSSIANGNTEYILDKTPRYYEILPEIKKIFPEAKIIVLKRNPLAV